VSSGLGLEFASPAMWVKVKQRQSKFHWTPYITSASTTALVQLLIRKFLRKWKLW
jgi:hypothetical protein